ncbi:conserved hypothetical protein [uncultured Desulfatiglans sp.]|nr:conserved hypothetical protein [uncultured Desulfatiglans sp.]
MILAMRAYLLDEIPSAHLERIKGFLDQNALHSRVDEIYWVQLPDDLLTAEQYSHQACRPHVFAVELGPDWVRFEFLIRSLHTMRCTCPGYCTEPQRHFVMHFADNMLKSLNIQT